MKKVQKLAVGVFIRIPLEDGSFGYGRVLKEPDTAFYNYRTTEPSTDLDTIAAQPVLFSQAVRFFDYKRWVNIGERPLEGEVAKPVVHFMQDRADFRKCVIYDTEGMEEEVGPEACIGLERAAVWDMPNIERRLLDTFMGRDNEEEIRLRVRLKDED